MNQNQRSVLLIIVVLLIVGITADKIFNSSSTPSTLNSKAVDSVVYVENGVSGVVSITDPFLNKTSDINVVYNPLDSGSGFIVNKDGYIVTAFHVVGDPFAAQDQGALRLMDTADIQKYIERAAVAGYVSKYNSQLGTELTNNSTSNSPVLQSQPDTNTTTDLLIQQNLIHVKSAKQQIRVRLPGSSIGDYDNANLLDVGNPETSEDVALLKIDTMFTQLNPLTLNSKDPSLNQNIRIFGYPVTTNGTYSNYNMSSLKPSSATGAITNEISNNGTIYYETTAQTTHGFSGGPVLDSNNNVLGIIIYSLINLNSSEQSGSVFISSDYIIKLCNKNNVSVNTV
jgi:S1-C subfamily serine protease